VSAGGRVARARALLARGLPPAEVALAVGYCDQPQLHRHFTRVVGIAEVASAAHPDPTQFDARSDYHDPAARRDEPRWLLVDVRFKRKLKRTITLEELKGRDELAEFALVRRGNRLSVMPVTRAQWDFILGLE